MSPPDRLAMTSPAHGVTATPPDSGNGVPPTLGGITAFDRNGADSAFTIAMTLRNRVPFALAGGWPVADVRYVADAHVAMLVPGRGSRRSSTGPGTAATWRRRSNPPSPG